MDGSQLRERVLHFARPLDLLLVLTGVDLSVFSNGVKRHSYKGVLKMVWASFWLILGIQSGLYLFAKRAAPLLVANVQRSSSQFIDDLNTILFRLCPLVFDGPFIHLYLVCRLHPLLASFCNELEVLDDELGRPDLPGTRRLSFIAVLWIVSTVVSTCCFSIYWDVCHPVRIVSGLEVCQNLIAIVTQLYPVAALWIFALCGRILVQYQRVVSAQLLQQGDRYGPSLLRRHRQLCQSADQLVHQFRWILFANTCFSSLTLFNSSYFVVEFIHDHYLIAALRQVNNFIKALFRLWLMCNTTDHIRKMKLMWIPSLRQLRGDPSRYALWFRRTRLSLLIEELTASANSSRSQGVPWDLFGLLPITSKMILRVMQGTLSFVVIVYQFKSVGNRYTSSK